MGVSPFLLGCLVDTLVKEKRPFCDLFQIHTKKLTLGLQSPQALMASQIHLKKNRLGSPGTRQDSQSVEPES